MTAPNHFYLFLTLSLYAFKTQPDFVPVYYISQDEKEESPTDEVLIEEARWHVAMIQMVGTVCTVCFLFPVLSMLLILTHGFPLTRKMLFFFHLLILYCSLKFMSDL